MLPRVQLIFEVMSVEVLLLAQKYQLVWGLFVLTWLLIQEKFLVQGWKLIGV